MKGLLIKDFKIILGQKRFFVMAIVFAAIFAWTTEDVTFAATYIVLLVSMLSLSTLSYDEQNGGMLFLLTLPTDRKSYVKEKYVLAFLNLIGACIVSLIVCIGFSLIKGAKPDYEMLVSSTMGMTVAMSLMLGITIPLELKYGVEKGRLAMIVAIAALALAGIGGYKLMTDVLHMDIEKIIVQLIAKLPETGMEVIMIGFMLCGILVILLVSYVIANKIMKKKEY